MHRDRAQAGLQSADGVDRATAPTSPANRTSRATFDGYLESAAEIYAGLPGRLAPVPRTQALRARVLFDGDLRLGSSLMAAQALGPKARIASSISATTRPNVNIEQIVASLVRAGRLAGFHFNDSKYGDDDLDAGSDRSVPAVPRVQRVGRRRRAQGPGVRSRLHARPVAQRHRSHRKPDAVGERGRARLCAGARCVDRAAWKRRRRPTTRWRRISHFEGGLSHRRLARSSRRRGGGAAARSIRSPSTARSGYRARKTEERPADARAQASGIV